MPQEEYQAFDRFIMDAILAQGAKDRQAAEDAGEQKLTDLWALFGRQTRIL